MLKRLVKPFARILYREGTVHTIVRGPARGLRYRIFPQYGLSPLYGGWEREAQALMVKHIRSDSIVYDVGANYGIHTLLMARLASAGRVYAFEPMPQIYEALSENVAFNGFNNVTCLRLALSEHTGRAEFATGHHRGAGHLSSEEAVEDECISVETLSLDDAVYERGFSAPTFLKVDVEGAESRVLRGGEKVLREGQPVILLELHNPEEDVAVGAILRDLGYCAFRLPKGERISRLDRGWPDPSGLWGQFIALPA